MATVNVKKRKFKKLRCIIHYSGKITGKLTPFSYISWLRVTKCAKQWLECDREIKENVISKRLNEQGFVNRVYNSVTQFGHLGFHRSCYQRFTNNCHIERALRAVKQPASIDKCPDQSTSGTSYEPPQKLKSASKLQVQLSISARTATTLPDVCIICKRTDRFVKIHNKRTRDKLMQAETMTAGKLYEAAIKKCDDSILLHIREKDCAAIGVKYHHSCYRDYTRFVTIKVCDRSVQEIPQFAKAYELYCKSVIETRIIRNQEVLRMSNLIHLFHHYVQEHEGVDPSSYRSDQLKRRLKQDYPQLIFHSPIRQNMCDIVYVDSLSTDTMVSRMNESEFESDFSPSDRGSQSTASASGPLDFSPSHTDSQSTASSPLKSLHHFHHSQQSLQTLFQSGVLINAAIKAKQSMESRCPPTSDNMNVQSCETVIPNELYNMLAWIIGASDECMVVDRVTVPQETHLLLLSICQDIVYMSSN